MTIKTVVNLTIVILVKSKDELKTALKQRVSTPMASKAEAPVARSRK